MNDVKKNFLVDRDNTGREIVFYPETGKKYYIEYIGGRNNWGDLNPATGKVEGSYGKKYKGSIKEEESVITKENGFDEIYEGEGSPYDKIDELHEKWKKENG
jgi:hypothetical protein